MWKMVSTCLLLCLWKEMNDITFEVHERTLEEISHYFSKLCIFGQLLMFLP